MSHDYELRFIVLGEVDVGKSSLLMQFAKNVFEEHLKSTINMDLFSKNIQVENVQVHLQLCDTAGQERYTNAITHSYYRTADGVILVYDVTNINSFLKLSNWFDKLKSMNENAVSIIVGNKIDHPNGKAVAITTVKSYAEEKNLAFYESSAKTGENVKSIFEELAKKVLEAKGIDPSRTKSKQKSHTSIASQTDESSSRSVTIILAEKQEEKKNSCC